LRRSNQRDLEFAIDCLLKGLQSKIAAQLARKVLALNIDLLPPDSKALKGIQIYFGWIPGEHRIVYHYLPQDDLVTVILVGKRNDDEIYKQLKRLF
jgi:mRNA interferase RelE/StbE